MTTPEPAGPDADARLARFIAAFAPEVAALAHDALARLRASVPGAVELVYDNYNALAIGFGATERASDAVLSVALYPRWVSLFFLQGASLPDPHRVLRGSGKQARHVRLRSAGDVDAPAVQALIAEAVARADPPIDGTRPRRIVVRSVSPTQRPRRPSRA